ncbi:MAG TPA: ATP-binding cassette domain-containing protein [Bacilli bacterium]|nr:ATP-binding cassette domain-containing protein [Bacilli bacterium]
MIELKNVNKSYGNINVLKNINLILPDKGLICILGESGSGKSTLLNLIGCLDNCTSGYISYDGNRLDKLSKKELDYYHSNIVSFIFQKYNLIKHFTVKDNINLTNNSNVNKLLQRFNIGYLRDKKITNLSGGEEQRVSILRAIAGNNRILLCDEPTGALDSLNSNKVMTILKNISLNTLVVVVTHNYELANNYADRIIKLRDGSIYYDSNPLNTICILKPLPKKKKLKSIKLLTIVRNNLLNKYKRNLLTIIAFSIGLIALSIVLGINHGFNTSLDKEEKETLSSYPIIISKTSTNIEKDLSDVFNKEENHQDDLIYSLDENHLNNINENYLTYLDDTDPYLKYKVYNYTINNHDYMNVSSINKVNYEEEFELLRGHFLESPHDVILVLNSNNAIDKNIMQEIGLDGYTYEYDKLLNYSYELDNITYTIVGILKSRDDSITSNITGLIYNLETKEIPTSIYLYPINYDNKQELLNYLNKYPSITYTDYSSSLKSISKTITKSITIILISFSLISLIVSTMMIGIITFINVMESAKEIGIYKSLGINNRNIKNIYYLENVILGILSSLLSIIITIICSIPINNLIFKLTGLTNVLSITINNLFIIVTLSITLSLVATFIPVKNVTKLNIIDVLRFD